MAVTISDIISAIVSNAWRKPLLRLERKNVVHPFDRMMSSMQRVNRFRTINAKPIRKEMVHTIIQDNKDSDLPRPHVETSTFPTPI